MTAAPPSQPTSTAPDSSLAGAELAMAGVSLAVVIGFTRLFDGWEYLGPLLAVLGYSHLVCGVLRRRGMGVPAAAAVSTAGFAVLASWLWFAETTTAGIPGGATIDALGTELDESWAAFRELTAPVPTRAGFTLAAGLALFVAIFLADWAAFRLWSPVEAMVPFATLFVFGALLGADQGRVLAAVAFGGTVLLFLLAHRVARLRAQSGWLTSDVTQGSRWLLRTGAALTAVAVVGGAVLGPRLPGSEAEALVDWRGGAGGPSSRTTVSPLVDIRQRLVDQSDIQVFTVVSDQQAYWRLTALDTFDGQIWRSGGRYASAGGRLPSEVPPGVATLQATQRYTITGLSALWLPAAYQPIAIDSPTGVRYQPESSTLIVDTDKPDSDDLSYEVVSAIPAPRAEQLEGPGAPIPEDMADYLALPADFSALAASEADQAIARAGATTPFQQALALQDYFLDRGVFADDGRTFTYLLPEVADPGHDGPAIERFLESGQGYCEQFAGTYAAMARSIGLPARVAVGFTWGDQDPVDPTLYRVQGRNAHAWPEVWLGVEVGWVAFEPTPGRGAPGMEYADVRPAQDNGGGEVPSTSTTTAPPTTVPTPVPDESGQLSPDELEGLLSGGSSTPSTSADRPLWQDPLAAPQRAPVLTALALVGLLALYAAAVTAIQVGARRRRRAGATDAAAAVRVSWAELEEDLALLGLTRRRAETASEFADRVGVVLPGEAGPVASLAAAADAAMFSDGSLDEASAASALATRERVSEEVQRQIPFGRRLWHRLDPRPVVRRHVPSRRDRVTSSG